MALHGHTRLELTDVHTGEVQVVEHDNLITNSVQRIISAFPQLMDSRNAIYTGSNTNWTDLWSWFYGGLLLYDTALDEDADTLYAPAGVGLTASARYNLVNSGTNVARGSYNTLESSIDYTNRELRLVYDFNTSQGNGTIAAVCLASLHGGAMGPSKTACSYVEQTSLGNAKGLWGSTGWNMLINASNRTYLSTYGVVFLLDQDRDLAWRAKLELGSASKMLSLYTMKAQLRTLPILQKNGSSRRLEHTLVRQIDVSDVVLSTTTSVNRLDYDESSGMLYLVCYPSSAVSVGGTIKVKRININTGETQNYLITNTLTEKISTTIYSTTNAPLFNGLVFEGRLYFKGDSTGNFYSVPLEDPTDVATINKNGMTFTYVMDRHHGRIYAADKSRGYVLDTSTMEISSFEVASSSEVGVLSSISVIPEGPMVLRASTNSSDNSILPAVREPYLASINNLPTPVEKTASQTMKVTYTLREAEE